MSFVLAGRYGSEAVLDALGRLTRSTLVNVYEADGVTLATLYADRTKLVEIANPISTDARGNLSFYADPGEYRLSIGGGEQTTVLVPLDPEEPLR